jgi:hypothetical protein
VLGDNRRSAVDSRFLGPIPLKDLIGKACLIYWSSERIPDPEDPERFTTGAIRWNRMGMRLD